MNSKCASRRRKRYEDYATENVWYKPYVEDLDLENLKAVPTKDELEAIMHKAKYEKDLEIKRRIADLTAGTISNHDASVAAAEIIKEAKQASTSDLAQYVAFRKAIIKLLKTAIRYTADGTYKTEKELHDILFPTNSTSKDIPYEVTTYGFWMSGLHSPHSI